MKDALRDIKQRIGKEVNDITVEQLVIGISYTGVLISTKDVGFANTPILEFSHESCEIFSSAGTLTVKSVIELAELAQSWDLSQRVVGVATLNALSQPAIKKSDDISVKYGDVVDLTKIRKDDTVVMIGNMQPSVEKLRRRAKEVLVLERSVELRDKGTFPDTAAEVVIPRGDVVFITGASLCNGTTDRILELCKNAREVVLLGASAGLFPPTLFRRGVTAVGPFEISDPQKTMRCISEGGGAFALLRTGRYVVYEPKTKARNS